jgi:hypothetical protein
MGVVEAKIQTVEEIYRLVWAAVANKQPMTADVARHLARLARLQRIVSTPRRYVHLRAGLIGELPRLQVRCSWEIRIIPFNAAHWRRLRASLAHAVEGIDRLDRELDKARNQPASVRELKHLMREQETTAGASACQMCRWLEAARQGGTGSRVSQIRPGPGQSSPGRRGC